MSHNSKKAIPPDVTLTPNEELNYINTIVFLLLCRFFTNSYRRLATIWYPLLMFKGTIYLLCGQHGRSCICYRLAYHVYED
jgi:hypothetical protein